MRDLVDKTTDAILAAHPNMPRARARQKAANLPRAIVFIIAGILLTLLGFGLVVFVLLTTKAAPSIPIVVLAAGPVLPGIWFLLAGGNLISGDAMDAAEQSGNAIARTAARALKAARSKDP